FEPQCPPQYERVVRRAGTDQRGLSSFDPLARDAAADASLNCRRSRARPLVRRVCFRCGVIASLPDAHLCRVPADDSTVRQCRSEYLEPLAGRVRTDFSDHRTVVPTTEPVLSAHRPLSGSATATVWLARHPCCDRLPRANRRRGFHTPGF